MRGFGLGLVARRRGEPFVPAVGQAAYTSPGSTTVNRAIRRRRIRRRSRSCHPRSRPDAGGDRERRIRARLPGGGSARADRDKQYPEKGLRRPCRRQGRTRPRQSRATRRRGVSRRSASTARRLAGATASPSRTGGYWYSWSDRRADLHTRAKAINGLFVRADERAALHSTGESELGSHSSGQLWAINEAAADASRPRRPAGPSRSGSSKTRTRICSCTRSIAGRGVYSSNEYGGLNWVQSSAVTFPNQVLTHNDAFHVYGARMDGNNWWIYYDGQWVGYIPHSRWNYRFPKCDQPKPRRVAR